MQHFFCDEWRDGNFLIPANKTYRAELLEQLERALVSERASDPSRKTHMKAIEQRIAAIKAYNAV